ncbi:complex III assembly factor LYRM7 [Culicoides brevitarsis]|uniref:complex III assembly factor LYRM7 n=1 Tax=Culicoides brevitarsis TaxID=469753 RepID=UPI00307CC738
MSSLRREVLQSFKNLHRARLEIFEGDTKALTLARQKINDEYRKNKGTDSEEEIRKKVALANDAAKELRTNVIQAVQKEPGVFEAKIRESTLRLDNYPFDPNAKIPEFPRKNKCKK